MSSKISTTSKVDNENINNQKSSHSNLLEYSLDKDLNKEYEEFNKKIKSNNKNLIIANSLICYGIYSYFKKYHKRIFDKKRGIPGNFISAMLHSLASISVILFTNAYFLGLTPSNLKKKKELEDKLMYQSNYQINYDLFQDILLDEEAQKP